MAGASKDYLTVDGSSRCGKSVFFFSFLSLAITPLVSSSYPSLSPFIINVFLLLAIGVLLLEFRLLFVFFISSPNVRSFESHIVCLF